jgi:hypothetical protein
MASIKIPQCMVLELWRVTIFGNSYSESKYLLSRRV